MTAPQLIGEFKLSVGSKWKYALAADCTVFFPEDDFGFANIADHTGHVWLELRGHYATIKAGYAWDGCSMVPTPAFMLLASLWHDCLGQFRQLPCLKSRLTGRRWNALFRQLGHVSGGRVVPAVYWFGLVIFNPAYQLAGRAFRPQEPPGKCLPV
jgi:hypothetical protein